MKNKIYKETWEKILKEYLESEEVSNYMCYRSKTFEELYLKIESYSLPQRKEIELKQEIERLVTNFTNSYRPSNGAVFEFGVVSRHSNLFIFTNASITNSQSEYELEIRAVRINFLNYCIANSKHSFFYSIYHTIKSLFNGAMAGNKQSS